MTLELDVIYNEDCLEGMKRLPDESVDLVVTDPPYGIGIDSWDVKVAVREFTHEVDRVLKKTGFYAFFTQMPTLLEWVNAAHEIFKFKEHITWVKRNVTPSNRLSRGHEDIFVYSKGASGFYETKGRYEDVKVPGLMFDIVSLNTINRYISSLWRRINTGHVGMKESGLSRHPVFSRFNSSSQRAPRAVNFTNVWSFAPHNCTAYNKGGKEHPCAKPILLVERLVEMLSKPGDVILDPFLGSGTTAIAAKMLNRRFIGMEIDAEYCEIAERRIATVEMAEQPDLFSEAAE